MFTYDPVDQSICYFCANFGIQKKAISKPKHRRGYSLNHDTMTLSCDIQFWKKDGNIITTVFL